MSLPNEVPLLFIARLAAGSNTCLCAKQGHAANFKGAGKLPGHPPLSQSHNLSGFLSLSLFVCINQSLTTMKSNNNNNNK